MLKLQPVFEKIKYNALEYVGIHQKGQDELTGILTNIVQQKGKQILLDTTALSDALAAMDMEATEIYRVCLMTQVNGFAKLLECDGRTSQLDLDRYIRNAGQETGLNADVVLRIASAIAFAVDIKVEYDDKERKSGSISADSIATLGYFMAQKKLDHFGEDFHRVIDEEADIDLDFDTLEPLVALGIPKAKYYLGYCLLYGVQLEENEIRGVALLREAAVAGDSESGAVLGDYYYEKGGSNHWSKAYDYYTGYGAVALNETRQEAVTDILNQKKFNRSLLGWCIALFVGMLISVIWAPGASVFAARPVWGWLSVAAELALLVLKILHFRAKPYDSAHLLPVAMTGVWFLYMAIRLLF